MMRPAIIGGILGVALAFLYGCATQDISANPAQDALKGLPKLSGPLSIEEGLKEAKFNFDNAILVGIKDPRILQARDCIAGVMTQLGLDPLTPQAPSFTPETKTLLGQGSVVFIRSVQVAGLAGTGITAPTGCKEQLGQLLLDAAAANANVLPGGGALIKIR